MAEGNDNAGMTKRERREARERELRENKAAAEAAKRARKDEDDDEPEVKYNNDIPNIRTMRQLDKVNLDFESPRLIQAMDDLGVSEDEMKKK